MEHISCMLIKSYIGQYCNVLANLNHENLPANLVHHNKWMKKEWHTKMTISRQDWREGINQRFWRSLVCVRDKLLFQVTNTGRMSGSS